MRRIFPDFELLEMVIIITSVLSMALAGFAAVAKVLVILGIVDGNAQIF